MTDELKLCPFCGGTPFLHYEEYTGDYKNNQPYQVCCHCGVEGSWYPADVGARSAWNTRYTPDVQAARQVKTWNERCEEHPDHNGVVTTGMIHQRMNEEIDDLRDYVDELEKCLAGQRFSTETANLRVAELEKGIAIYCREKISSVEFENDADAVKYILSFIRNDNG